MTKKQSRSKGVLSAALAGVIFVGASAVYAVIKVMRLVKHGRHKSSGGER